MSESNEMPNSLPSTPASSGMPPAPPAPPMPPAPTGFNPDYNSGMNPQVSSAEVTHLAGNNEMPATTVMSGPVPTGAPAPGWAGGPAMGMNPTPGMGAAGASAPYSALPGQMGYPGAAPLGVGQSTSQKLNGLKAKVMAGKATDIFVVGIGCIVATVLFQLLGSLLLSTNETIFIICSLLAFLCTVAATFALALAFYNQLLTMERTKEKLFPNGQYGGFVVIAKVALIIMTVTACLNSLFLFIIQFKVGRLSAINTIFGVTIGAANEFASLYVISLIFIISLLTWFGGFITFSIAYTRMLKVIDAFHDHFGLIMKPAAAMAAPMAPAPISGQPGISGYPGQSMAPATTFGQPMQSSFPVSNVDGM